MKEIIANNKNSIVGSQNHVYTTTIGAVLRCRLAAFVFMAVAVPVAVGGVCPCMETCLRRLVGRDSPLGLFSLNPRPVSSRRGLLLRVAALLLLAASLASPLFSTGGTAHAAVLVSNMGNRMFAACAMGSSLHGGGTHIHSDCTQSFTTGSNAAGYTLTSIELALGAGLYTNPPTVKLFSESATGTVEATFTGPTSLTENTASEAYTFTPSSPVTLSMSTKYWVVAEGGSNFINWSNTESTDEDDTPATGWSISNKGGSRSADSTGSFTETGLPRKIRVNGTIAPTASDNTVTTDEDTDYMFTVASFNDTLSSVKIVTLPGPGKGTLKLDATAIVSDDLPKTVTKGDLDSNKLEYSPPSNGNGTGYASFTFKVNDGMVDSILAYTMTIDINQMNDQATGKPTIGGTARVSQTLTADISGIADVDGSPGGFAYQWRRFASNGTTFEANIGTNSSTYTLQPSDAGKRIKVEVRFTDNDGNSEGPLTSDAHPSSGTVASGNSPPTASDNMVTTDEDTDYMFTVASFNYLDSDTLSSVKIVTLPGSGKGTLKLDATAIVSDDLPKTVTKGDLDSNKLEYSPPSNGNGTGYASFTFKVNDGMVDSILAYTMTIDINQMNDQATGKPTIGGTARVSQMLTADISGIADVDGSPGGFAYQWRRFASNGTTFEANIGTNSSTYTLQPSDAGKRIKVEVRFTDNDGNSEGPLTSDAHPSSGTVASGNSPPTASDNMVTTDEDTDYMFTVASFNDTLSSVKIVTLPGPGKGTLKLDATAIVSDDLPKTVTKGDLDSNKLEYSPPSNGNGTGYASFTFKVNDGMVDSILAYTMTIDINQMNDQATGKPTIGGTARVSQMLTADISGIADVDGSPGGFAYQWRRFASNGTTFEANIGTNSSTYTLQPSDAGKRIKVEVRFTDNDGNSEGPLTSDAHPSSDTIAPTAIAPTVSDNTVTTDEDTGEGAALVALYEATSGENWEDDTNWKTDEPLHTWYGVTLDTEGWVTGLDLGGNGLRRGIPPAVVVNLRRLRRLYLNDNRLTAVPLAQLEALVSMSDPVLEELALWGNQGLVGMENISPELGRRVDRAALRALYDNNGGPGWREEENWLDEADPFSFSVWYGVMTNDNGRVSELDLDGNGLTGELTNGLEELRGLERLDLYGNAGLSGVLPLGLVELPELGMVDIGDTGVCAPEDAAFQRWLADIDFRGEICAEDADEDRLEQSGGGGCAVTSTSNTGYTPHSTAFDLLLVVSAMLLLIPIKMNTNSERT